MDFKNLDESQKQRVITETDLDEALEPHRDQLHFLGSALEQSVQLTDRATRGLGCIIHQIEQNLGNVSKDETKAA